MLPGMEEIATSEANQRCLAASALMAEMVVQGHMAQPAAAWATAWLVLLLVVGAARPAITVGLRHQAQALVANSEFGGKSNGTLCNHRRGARHQSR